MYRYSDTGLGLDVLVAKWRYDSQYSWCYTGFPDFSWCNILVLRGTKSLIPAKNADSFIQKGLFESQIMYTGAGLPDGLFSLQFGNILKSFEMENVGIFYVHFGIFYGPLVYFVVIWYVLL
jgi:hypothetical protein